VELGAAREERRGRGGGEDGVEGEPFTRLGRHASPPKNTKGPARKCRVSPVDCAMGFLSRQAPPGQGASGTASAPGHSGEPCYHDRRVGAVRRLSAGGALV